MSVSELDNFPDSRDGRTRKERLVLYCLDQLHQERGGRNAPTAMLYGRVLEYVDISEHELQLILQRLSDHPSWRVGLGQLIESVTLLS